MVGRTEFPARMITSEPLVGAKLAVRQFRGRAVSLTVLPAGLEFTQPGEWNPAEGKSKILLPWNEAPLNFVSLRSSLHYVGLGRLSRVEMNAQKTGALTAAQPKGEACLIFA